MTDSSPRADGLSANLDAGCICRTRKECEPNCAKAPDNSPATLLWRRSAIWHRNRIPIRDHILAMFFKRVREAVVPVAVADEIQVVGVRWVHGRFERRASWIRNWPGRQAGKLVGVVERFVIEVGAVDAAIEAPRQQRRVNHARIRL